MTKIIKYIFIIFCLGMLSGCATEKDMTLKAGIMRTPFVKPTIPGVYHSVKKGQTLWRISRIYAVDLEKLADFNKINNTCKIEVGQKIFIPDSFRSSEFVSPEKGVTTTFIWPYKGNLLSCFRQPKQNVENQGIDIAARNGGAVSAAAAGNVIFTSDNMRGYGKTIIILHKDNFTTVYTNNKKNLVKTGDYIRQGQIIANAGTTGRTSRCTLHFELRKNNKPQNPLLYLP